MFFAGSSLQNIFALELYHCLHTLQVYCICSVADAPARAQMLNTLQYNGYYGCGWCLHPGVAVDGNYVHTNIFFGN